MTAHALFSLAVVAALPLLWLHEARNRNDR